MKKSAVVAALAAAVVAIPVAAEAATYTPISFNTPRGDVRTPSGRTVSFPSIDVTGISGHRYAGNFQVKVYFNDLTQTRYVRRMVFLGDTSGADNARSTLIESRVGSDPTKPVADVIEIYYSGNGAIVYKRCPGVRGSVDYAGNKITYTLPTECFFNISRNAAELYAVTYAYHASTWRNAPYSGTERAPDAYDVTDGRYWRWASASRSDGAPAARPDVEDLIPR